MCSRNEQSVLVTSRSEPGGPPRSLRITVEILPLTCSRNEATANATSTWLYAT